MNQTTTNVVSGNNYILCQPAKMVEEKKPTAETIESIKVEALSEPIRIKVEDTSIKKDAEAFGSHDKDASEPILRYNAVNNTGRDDTPYCLRRGPWDDKSSKFLIKLLGRYPSAYFYLDRETNRIAYWEIIRQKLEDRGYKFSLFQVRMHWRSLMRVFKKTVDNNELNGTNNECQYYKEMTECLGRWDREATLLLITQVVLYNKGTINQSGCMKLRMKAWITIARKMQSLGFKYQPYQLQARWRMLIQLYQLAVRHNTKNPDDRIMTAYHEELQAVYEYVPILNERETDPDDPQPVPTRQHHKTFTLKHEREFLDIYEKHMCKFMEKDASQYDVWCQIYKEFISQTNLGVSLQQLRNCFYELKRRLSQVKEHNSHPGAIHKIARHADILERIYNVYNCWPHNRTKMVSLSKIKNRQFHTQMMWTEQETSTLLSIYPEVLVDYQCSKEPLPYMELSQRITNKLVEHGYSKRPALEVEIFMQQLRRGYARLNLHPFNEQFKKILILEDQLGFKPPVSVVKLSERTGGSGGGAPAHSKPDLQYWSQEATLIMLESIKEQYDNNSGTELSFMDLKKRLAESNYDYSSMECKEYFNLLKRIYQNGIKYLRSKRRILKPFAYAQEMQEVFKAMKESQRKGSLFINSNGKRVLPFPADSSSAKRAKKKESYAFDCEWSLEADQMLLVCVRSAQNACHTWKDFNTAIEKDSSLWVEAVRSLESNGLVDPSMCYERFQEILKEYKKASYSALFMDDFDSSYLLERIEDLVSTFCSHDAELDARDLSWEVERTRDWPQFSGWANEDILELLFILAELNQQEGLAPDPGMWFQVSAMMTASHRTFSPKSCYSLFCKLHKSYLLFWQRNLYCKEQNKAHPAFYFKFFSLFGPPDSSSFISKLVDLSPGESLIPQPNSLHHNKLFLRWFVALRGEKCHPVPRLKLLEKMVQFFYKHFETEVEPADIWSRLVHLHFNYLSSLDNEDDIEASYSELMKMVWTHHENPLRAYNLVACKLPMWEKICHWSTEILDQFLTECTSLIAETSSLSPLDEANFLSTVAARLRQSNFSFSGKEVRLILDHLVRAFLHGGYGHWRSYLSLIVVLQPSLAEEAVAQDGDLDVADPDLKNLSLRASSPCSRLKAPTQGLLQYGGQCARENNACVGLIKEMHREEMHALNKLAQLFRKIGERLVC